MLILKIILLPLYNTEVNANSNSKMNNRYTQIKKKGSLASKQTLNREYLHQNKDKLPQPNNNIKP